jgi:hypothetical protein
MLQINVLEATINQVLGNAQVALSSVFVHLYMFSLVFCIPDDDSKWAETCWRQYNKK